MEVAEIAVSALAGLVGALIGAGATLRSAKAERRAQERVELLNSLTNLLVILDRLALELSHIPRKTRLTNATDRSLDRLPNLEFLIGWLSRKTIGRDGMRVVDEFLAVGRRTMLLAPDDVLRAFEQIALLLSEDRTADDWSRRWSEGQDQLTIAARGAIARLGA